EVATAGALDVGNDEGAGGAVRSGREVDDLVQPLQLGVDRLLDGVGVVGDAVTDSAEILRSGRVGDVERGRARRRADGYRRCGGHTSEAGGAEQMAPFHGLGHAADPFTGRSSWSSCGVMNS